MSKHGHDSGHGHGSSGSSDTVDYSKVVGVGVASLVIFAISIWWSATILHSATAEAEARAGKAKSFDLKRTEIGIVDQVPFVVDKRLPEWRARRKAELDGYGWIDRAKGIVHIPIEDAMNKVAGGMMPAGAPR
jgi:hypothetical protein